ncbi:MAG: filamentous hemagglutinin N-terminal domain-containing protein, partial [Leptolyngbyaceae cyanobacterium CRU_2_3]|nr:filamentous hemagglutinin N-terminal domain-containing protein [Leptolyngbyaceae cyanobacterium CRU_2_3]
MAGGFRYNRQPTCEPNSRGAQRGNSLFHSFQEFNVGARQQVYFANPPGVRNILTRVTGHTVSRILGTLGVNGSANLFLLNPHGIVLGRNAQLNLAGSFLATTADRFVFPDKVTFGSVHPEAPPLFSVNVPIGLQYGEQPGAITSRAHLSIYPGQSLILAGGTLDLTNSLLEVYYPIGGRIELGSSGSSGTVGLTYQDDLLSLSFPTDLERADVSLDHSRLDARAENGGNIAITGRSLSISGGSELLAGIPAGFGFKGSQAGDITLDATEAVRVDQASSIANLVAAATDFVPAAIGNAGNIHISTGSLSVLNRAVLSSSTLGRGNAGSIIINARDRVEFDQNAVFSNTGEISPSGQVIRASGRGGDIRISTGSLSLRKGAFLTSSTLGRGNAGSIIINAHRVELSDLSSAFSNTGDISPDGQVIQASGRGGDIRISTGSLSLRNGAQLYASTDGNGNAGNVMINARDRVEFDQQSAAFSRVGGLSANGAVVRASGRGGDVRITTGSLFVHNGSQLDASTNGSGNAGSVMIDARDRVEFG